MIHAARIVIASIAAALLLVGSPWAQVTGSGSTCGGFSDGFEPPGFGSPITDSLVFDDGSGPALYLSGYTFRANGIEVQGVARWDGTTLTQLGSGIDARIADLCVFDDGTGPKLAAGGSFAQGSTYEARAALWDGQQWTLLGFVPHSQWAEWTNIASLAVFDAGAGPRLFTGGHFGGEYGSDSIRQWDGTNWVSVGGGLFGSGLDLTAFVSVLHVFDDGSGPALYAGGRFSRTGAPSGTYISVNIARWSGGVWTSVGNGLGNAWDDNVQALEGFDDGSGPKLVAGGTFVPLPVGAPFKMAQWDGVSWTPFAADAGGNVSFLRAFDGSFGLTPGLWVGGSFTQAGNVPAHNLARWNGTSWSAIGTDNLLAPPTTIVSWDDGSGHGTRAIAGALNGVLEWLENGVWSPATGGPGADSSIESIAVLEHPGAPAELFVSGQFTTIGGISTNRFARFDGTRWWDENPDSSAWPRRMRVLDAGDGLQVYGTGAFIGPGGASSNVARRDGGSWILLPPVPTFQAQLPKDLAVFDDGSGPKLYASGAYGVWRLSKGAWSDAVGQPNHVVTDMLVFDDGHGPALFFAGAFQTIAGVPFRGIARWNGQALDDLDGGANASAPVEALCVFDDGSGPALFAAGKFTSMGGVACSALARWNGQTWSPVGSGLQNVFLVNDLFVHDDGSGAGPELVVTGHFSGAGGSPAGNIARWNGTQWRTMDGGVAGPTPGAWAVGNALAAYDDRSGRGPDLIVGGVFAHAGTAASSCIARWTSCGGHASTFCFGDGSGTACPCGNASASGAQAGCLNSLGMGGTMRAHGRASLSDDTLVLEGGSMPITTCLYYQGQNLVAGGAGVVFGDGVKCTAGPFVRLGNKFNPDGSSTYPGLSDPTLSVRGHVMTPGTRHYQARYRNSAAFCSPDTFNYTSGVSVVWSN